MQSAPVCQYCGTPEGLKSANYSTWMICGSPDCEEHKRKHATENKSDVMNLETSRTSGCRVCTMNSFFQKREREKQVPKITSYFGKK